jgi:hypothetical protein
MAVSWEILPLIVSRKRRTPRWAMEAFVGIGAADRTPGRRLLIG